MVDVEVDEVVVAVVVVGARLVVDVGTDVVGALDDVEVPSESDRKPAHGSDAGE